MQIGDLVRVKEGEERITGKLAVITSAPCANGWYDVFIVTSGERWSILAVKLEQTCR